MASSKEVIFTPESIPSQLQASEKALELYSWAIRNAGLTATEEGIADFVSQRNAKTAGLNSGNSRPVSSPLLIQSRT